MSFDVQAGIDETDLTDLEIRLLNENAMLRSGFLAALERLGAYDPPARSHFEHYHLGEASDSAELYVLHTAADMAVLVAGMGNLMSGLAALPVFSSMQIDLAGWVTLSVLQNDPGLTSLQVGRQIGSSRQRTQLVLDSLFGEGLIERKQVGGSKELGLHLTDAGRAKLAAINSELLPAIREVVKHSPLHLLNASRRIRRFARMLVTPDVAGTST